MPISRVLQHLREQRRLSIEAVAAYAHISAARLVEFEDGKREPSFSQIEALTSIYGVPPYLVAADQLPNIPDTPLDYRRQQVASAELTPQGMRRLWSSERIAQFAKQLATELKFVAAKFFQPDEYKDLSAASALRLRELFDDWMAKRSERFAVNGAEEFHFFVGLRLFIESQGVAVNVDEAPAEDYMGFYVIPDNSLQLLFVNRKVTSRKAQLFTLVHEFAHYIVRTEGISNPFMVNNNIERACNRFAANFLAPDAAFSSVAEDYPRDARHDVFGFVQSVSRRSLLSGQATAIRLAETGHISRSQLNQFMAARGFYSSAEKDEEKAAAKSNRGSVHAKRIGELGYLPVALTAAAVRVGLIDSYDAKQSLGLAQSIQADAFSLATRRMQVASAP